MKYLPDVNIEGFEIIHVW